MLWGSPQTSMQGVLSLRSLLLPAAVTFLPVLLTYLRTLRRGLFCLTVCEHTLS